jgi:hypothetical protein
VIWTNIVIDSESGKLCFNHKFCRSTFCFDISNYGCSPTLYQLKVKHVLVLSDQKGCWLVALLHPLSLLSIR